MSLVILTNHAPISATTALGAYDPTGDLLTAFSSRCPLNYGTVNEQAITDSTALKSIVAQLKEDSDCSGVWGALDALNSTVTTATLYAPDADEAAYNSSQSYCSTIEDELANYSSSTSDADVAYTSYLSSDLATCKYSAFSHTLNLDLSKQSMRYSTIYNTQLYAAQLFSQLSTADKCLVKNPSIPSQILSQVLGLSSTLVGGLYGSAMFLGSALLDQTIKFIHDHKYNKISRDLVRSSLNTALNCGFEAIASSYCSAAETERNIKAIVDIESNTELHEPWVGVDLIKKDNAEYLTWASQLSAAGDGSNSDQIDYEIKVISYRSDLEQVKKRIDKYKIEEAKAKTDTDKISQRDYLIDWIASSSALEYFYASKLDGSNPYCSLRAYLYNGEWNQAYDSKNYTSCSNWIYGAIKTKTGTPAMAQIESVTKELISFSTNEINTLADGLNTDSTKIIRDGYSGKPVSAIDFIERADKYLAWLKSDLTNKLNDKGIETKRKQAIQRRSIKAGEILAAFATAHQTLDNEKLTDKEKTKKLAEVLSPASDYTKIMSDLQSLVESDIQDRLSSGEMKSTLQEIVKYSTTRRLDEVNADSSRFDINSPAAILNQATDAKRSAIQNMSALGKTFQGVIRKNLKDFALAKKKKNDVGTFSAAMNNTCITLSLLPNEFQGLFSLDLDSRSSLCADASVKDVSSELELKFSELIKRPYEDRLCSLYQFNKRSDLFTKLRRAGVDVSSLRR